MKITICGSIAFYDEMLELKAKLVKVGHKVKLPPLKIKNNKGKMISVKEYYEIRKKETNPSSWVWKQKSKSIKEHFKKEQWADAILVANYDKNGIKGYVGGNTLMEMGVAFFLKKPIYLLNEIPEVSYKEEIVGMFPIVLKDNLTKI
jgi:nucleoside 2-deoxyribosyltransferase